jgi:hypothetical protein
VNAVHAEERGVFFHKKQYIEAPLPTFSESRKSLPSPILEGNPEWVEMYWKCWDLAFTHLRKPDPNSPFVSNYIDEAFNNKIYQWDTVFMVMFWRYAHAVFPAVESFDNFYCRQHPDGYICRAIFENGKIAGQDYSQEFTPRWRDSINPPLFSWAEVECYRVSGDKTRFAEVLPVLEKYVEWLRNTALSLRQSMASIGPPAWHRVWITLP